ncbi:AP-2 adaptor complex subunit Apm4 [Schizosaccharomyces japonicus yFS275]|uniref:AP-2 adaptor complex subunit Apm4 n=1 Tax=Schizosaccharomyces japonicus (strain yFS275 / FY16936) TaxID=402676 RepID=B6JWM2_SCHJY|nr:AP-2 adaptor complex subunit Apm4 [Schizosaccharomyces japonicus yFS275]EEB05773.1 AP-2 adaptor complex subunit Apm4 [Schizosaccharomyces japonicus yFS275]
MISGFFLFNLKGETLICRTFRHELKRSVTDIFRVQVISNTEIRSPIVTIGSNAYFFIKHNNLYVVAICKGNVNTALVLEFIDEFIQLCSRYFGKLNESSVKDNFIFIYELLDELIDFGVPQTTEMSALKSYLSTEGIKSKGGPSSSSEKTTSQRVTAQLTGAISWRGADVKHRKNTIYVDVIENMNLLIGTTGNVLRADVSGVINLRTMLNGMPECELGLNDKLSFDLKGHERGYDSKKSFEGGVHLEDCQFHQCVRLQQFEDERKIVFIPPDGNFELMKYRARENIHIPFRVNPIVEQVSKNKVVYRISIRSSFSSKLASSVSVCVPVPLNATKVSVRSSQGKSKYKPSENCIHWKLARFMGQTEHVLSAEAELSHTTVQQQWSRPPISLDFNILMFTSSGTVVRYLKVYDYDNPKYKSIKWVRYSTRAGSYEIRI